MIQEALEQSMVCVALLQAIAAGVDSMSSMLDFAARHTLAELRSLGATADGFPTVDMVFKRFAALVHGSPAYHSQKQDYSRCSILHALCFAVCSIMCYLQSK